MPRIDNQADEAAVIAVTKSYHWGTNKDTVSFALRIVTSESLTVDAILTEDCGCGDSRIMAFIASTRFWREPLGSAPATLSSV